jgi:hypothetical protein
MTDKARDYKRTTIRRLDNYQEMNVLHLIVLIN